jgi:hypothetical protein
MKRILTNRVWGVLAGLSLLGGLLTDAWAADAPAKKRLVLVPFQIERTEFSEIMRCRACGNILAVGKVEGDPSPDLTLMVWDLLNDQVKGYEWISPGQVEGVYQTHLAKKIDQDPKDLMKSIGQELKADGVIWGGIFRYQNRKGTAYGVKEPASVSFDLHLLRVSDGSIVWKTQWTHSQKSLSEDLFQLGEVAKKGLRWMTAEELSRSGLTEMIKSFPGPNAWE